MNANVFIDTLCDLLRVRDLLTLRRVSRAWLALVDDERVWAVFQRRLGVVTSAAAAPAAAPTIRRACFEIEENRCFLAALAHRRHPVLTSLVEGTGEAYSRDDYLATMNAYRAGFVRGYLLRSLGLQATREHDVVELEHEVHRALTSAGVSAPRSLDALAVALSPSPSDSRAPVPLDARTCATTTLCRLTYTLAEPLDASALDAAIVALRPFGATRRGATAATGGGGLWATVGDTTYSLECARLSIVTSDASAAHAYASFERLLSRRLSIVAAASSRPLCVHGHLTRRQAALMPLLRTRLACGATLHRHAAATTTYTLVATNAEQLKRASGELSRLLRAVVAVDKRRGNRQMIANVRAKVTS